jgi:peptidoglycan-associated lipoprotein
MRIRNQVLFVLVLTLAAVSSSQTVPAADKQGRSELAVDYTYLHTNAPPGDCGCFTANGGSVSYAYRFANHFSLVGDGGWVYSNKVNGTNAELTLGNFLGGIRYSSTHSMLKLRPFGEYEIGGSHATGSLSPRSLGIGAPTAFALGTGGGFDLPLGHHFSWRVIQADYLLTLFKNQSNDHQNNIRLQSGLVISFGHTR